MFCSSVKSRTSPCLCLSSGMWLMHSPRAAMLLCEMSRPQSVTLPDSIFSSPVSPYTSSVWPLPSMPAMQTISPSRTSKLTPFTASLLCILDRTCRSSTFSTVSFGFASSFCISSWTGRPTIMFESSCLFVSQVFTVPIHLPLRSTVTRSETSIISLSLCEMNRMLLPSLAKPRIVCMSSSISCGVSTAVGSSKISISLSLYSILSISTRCCMPTVMSSTFASRSTLRPYFSESASTFLRASLFCRKPSFVVSAPRMMLSSTVKTSMSLKCWCTMPMPRAVASFGSLIFTASPFFLMMPSSGWYMPKRTLISVLLPAPFSPRSACISPRLS